MNAFFYGVALQLKMDIRSRSLFVTCYLVPLLFFALMGGIFTSVMPDMKQTLTQSMTVMGVSMGALIGLPVSVAETYGGDIKKVYKANGVPLHFGLIAMFISSFIHLLIMCIIICITAPVIFDASVPANLLFFFFSLSVFIAVSLSIGCILGLAVKNQAKLTMFSQVIFLPSIMLSGIMFPAEFLPEILKIIGKLFPASWGYLLMTENAFSFNNMLPLLAIFFASIILCWFLLKMQQDK